MTENECVVNNRFVLAADSSIATSWLLVDVCVTKIWKFVVEGVRRMKERVLCDWEVLRCQRRNQWVPTDSSLLLLICFFNDVVVPGCVRVNDANRCNGAVVRVTRENINCSVRLLDAALSVSVANHLLLSVVEQWPFEDHILQLPSRQFCDNGGFV